MSGADPVDEISSRLQALIASMQPDERRRLTRAIGQNVRRIQSRRIGAQQNPDGGSFAPRATPSPGWSKERKKGRVRKMFVKLKQSRWLKIIATAEMAEIGYGGRVGRLARDHQDGLRTRKFRLPARRLLGFSAGEEEMIINEVIDHLADSRR